jgi:hypothetical protein
LLHIGGGFDRVHSYSLGHPEDLIFLIWVRLSWKNQNRHGLKNLVNLGWELRCLKFGKTRIETPNQRMIL